MFPDPGPVSVRSGPGKLGVSGCPAGLYLAFINYKEKYTLKYSTYTKVTHIRIKQRERYKYNAKDSPRKA